MMHKIAVVEDNPDNRLLVQALLEEFYEIFPEEGDIVMSKHRSSAFIGTPFEGILRAQGVKTLMSGRPVVRQ